MPTLSRSLPFVFAVTSALAPVVAHAKARCFALCAFHSSHTDRDLSDPEAGTAFVEMVTVHVEGYTKLAKYQRELMGEGEDAEDVLSDLFVRCMDTAAARSSSLFGGTPYAPRMVDSQTGSAATAERSCGEAS